MVNLLKTPPVHQRSEENLTGTSKTSKRKERKTNMLPTKMLLESFKKYFSLKVFSMPNAANRVCLLLQLRAVKAYGIKTR